jgi:hypothetical protein
VTRHRGATFWVATAAGWMLITWGLRGIAVHRIDTRPGELLRFFVTGLAAHDLVLAPVVLAAGIGVTRIVPGRWRAPVQAALLTAGTTLLYAYPLVRGYGHRLGNPTSLPRNYGAGVVVVVAVVCVGVLAGHLAFHPANRKNPR